MIANSEHPDAFTMPAGRYFIGDPCYVLDDEWDEVIDLIIKGSECLEGEFALASGRKFAIFNTAYGDGTYQDQDGNNFPVDSGSLGCVELMAGDSPPLELGCVFMFDSPFIVERHNNVIYLGHFRIDTGDEDDEDDNWDDDDDEFPDSEEDMRRNFGPAFRLD